MTAEPDFVTSDFRRTIRLDIPPPSYDPAQLDPTQRDPDALNLQGTPDPRGRVRGKNGSGFNPSSIVRRGVTGPLQFRQAGETMVFSTERPYIPSILSRAPETWAGTWSRRALTLPGYLLVFLLSLGAFPLWGPLLILLDLVQAPRRMPRIRAATFLLFYLAFEVLGVGLAGCVWIVRLGGRVGGAVGWVEANAALQRFWTGGLFRIAQRVLGFRLELDADSASVDEGPFLLFVRHTSTADTILAAALIANPHAIVLRYVLKRELLWDPCLDIVGKRLPNTFVARGSGPREAEIAAIAELAVGLGRRDGALIYPEGTRFSPAKLEASRARLRADGKVELAVLAERFRNVLPPRIGGPLALLEAAPGVDVVVLEHVGFEGAATLGTLWAGHLVGSTVRARLRRIPAADIPATDRDRWLFTVWAETDSWVTSHSG